MKPVIGMLIGILGVFQFVQYAISAKIQPQCPSPEEIEAFRQRVTGQLFTPEDPGYEDTTYMLMNRMFNSYFGFVLYATSQGLYFIIRTRIRICNTSFTLKAATLCAFT